MSALTPEADALAAAQHGIVTRPDLLALPDVDRHVIDGWLRAGILISLWPGVYRVVGCPLTRVAAHYAAVRRAGVGAVAADESALGLGEVEGFGVPKRPRIAVEPERRVTGVSFVVCRTPLASPPQCLDGVPAMGYERALIGASPRRTPAQVRAAYDDLRRRRELDQDLLHHLAVSLGQVPGAPVMRGLLRSGFQAQESEGERSLALIFRPEDPPLHPQVWVEVEGRWYRLDLAILITRLNLEYDGEDHHTIDGDRHRDAERDLALESIDVRTLRITTPHLRAPERTRQRVLAVHRKRLAAGYPPLVPLTPPFRH